MFYTKSLNYRLLPLGGSPLKPFYLVCPTQIANVHQYLCLLLSENTTFPSSWARSYMTGIF